MSPLWGFGLFVCPVFYKHVAPLGLRRREIPPVYKDVAPLGLENKGDVARL